MTPVESPLPRAGWSVPTTLWLGALFVALLCVQPKAAGAQTEMDAFHWVDFHGLQNEKDPAVVQWVTAALRAEKWTAIREIGVEYDAALVITSERATSQATPPNDIYTVWSVSLAKKEVHPLFHAIHPRILDWTNFAGQMLPELGLIYDDCTGCDATTYFTTLYYSFADHGWRARWVHGDQAAVLRSAGNVGGVERSAVYGLVNERDGRQVLARWEHFDYGKAKPPEDYVYQYSVDPMTGLEQVQVLGQDHAKQMQLRLCQIDASQSGQADPALAELTHGQDSTMCQAFVKGNAKPTRRPTTTPPANNRGISEPPGGHRMAPTAKPAEAPKPDAKTAPRPDAAKPATPKP